MERNSPHTESNVSGALTCLPDGKRKLPLSRPFSSRRPDSNRGSLHYEFWAAVILSHCQSPQVTRRTESAGVEMTDGDPR
jgi:hypothetical protein